MDALNFKTETHLDISLLKDFKLSLFNRENILTEYDSSDVDLNFYNSANINWKTYVSACRRNHVNLGIRVDDQTLEFNISFDLDTLPLESMSVAKNRDNFTCKMDIENVEIVYENGNPFNSDFSPIKMEIDIVELIQISLDEFKIVAKNPKIYF